MENLEAIRKYCEYLEKEAGFNLTIYRKTGESENEMLFRMLPIQQVHFNSYCMFVKDVPGMHKKCLECQRKAIDKCSIGKSFGGICHAGVFEYVYPLKFGNVVAGALSVGAYKADDFGKFAKTICDNNAVTEYSSALKSDIPEKERVDTLIIPLLCMIKNVFLYNELKAGAPILQVVAFCERSYTKKITVENLSKRFFCSTSYIARNFKKETGKSLPEFINDLRIKNAMQLLQSTNSDIAQIGATVGYDDPSYFTKCFMKIAGVTPKVWRNRYKKSEQ